MSFGKMNFFIEIIEERKTKDSSGFVITHDEILASVRAYKEARHGTVAWANRAVFSKASVIFRFRNIPGLAITTAHIIVCDTGRYRILSVEDIKSKKMHTEILAEEVKLSGTI